MPHAQPVFKKRKLVQDPTEEVKISKKSRDPSRRNDEHVNSESDHETSTSATSDENDRPEVGDSTGAHDTETESGSDASSIPEDEDEDEDEDDIQDDSALRTISFGALADAQDSLTSNSNSKAATTSTTKESLQSLRDRLSELRGKKDTATPTSAKRKSSSHDTGPSRTSKHAPTSQSSKYQVSRRREVVPTAGHIYDPDSARNRLHGDPRFSAANGGVDALKVARNYEFLSSYAQQELDQLKSELADVKRARKRRKGKVDEAALEAQEETLKVEVGRRENRLRAERKREKERQVVQEHKKKEREAVKEGKRPFFLKKGAVRGEVEKQRWEGMKAKERQKAEKKKRKREEGKEMKRMPGERRSFG